MKRVLIILAVGIPFIISIVILLVRNPASPAAAFPNPNGYEQLLAAAAMLNGSEGELEDLDSMSQAELTAVVTTNSEALSLARSALTNQCRLPTKYLLSVPAPCDEVKALRHLALVMTAQGRLAEQKEDLSVAAKDYLEVIDLGLKAYHGGAINEAFIGFGSERYGLLHLETLAARLDAESCRSAMITLENLETKRDAWEDILHQEILRTRAEFPSVMMRLTIWYHLHKEVSQSREKFKTVLLGQKAESLQIEIRLAARAYELDHGKAPLNIQDLVPGYLKAVPIDPVSHKELGLPPPPKG